MGAPGGPRTELTADEAARVLRLPVESIAALVGSGYLHPAAEAVDGPRFAMGDLKAFLARNAGGEDARTDDTRSPLDALEAFEDLDPQALLVALDGRSEDMARRALDILVAAVPEASRWSLTQRARFVEGAKARFEAILAVSALGEDVDASLIEELTEVGGSAAWSGSSLPEVLLVLRISRDLVVQTAVEVAEERGRRWGLALSLLLTRVLPVLDRLTDAIARGYWSAFLDRERETQARYEHIVEQSSDGVYEIDLDGRIRYANPSLAMMLGRRVDDLVGSRLTDVLLPADGDSAIRLDAEQSEVVIRRADGVVRVLDVRSVERRTGDAIVGYDAVVRDLTAARRLEEQKNDFLALITHELRQPLTTILGLGITLDSYAERLSPDRIHAMGSAIHQQAERISRLADDLFDISRLEYDSLLLTLRAVDLRKTVDAALTAIPAAGDVDVRVPAGLEVLADPRRLEQVVANLVDNALTHGAPPVVIEAEADQDGSGEVELVVRDHGTGVDPGVEATLFSELRLLTGVPRRRRPDTGLGLALVRGLVEAMGGRVWYEPGDEGGACFLVRLTANRRG